MSAPLRLSIRRGDQEVASAVARDTPQKIGRSKQCDVILDDPAVSRVHALLSIEGGETVLVDQNSQNGLWVQGNKVTRIVLDPSVVVAMGPFRIVCEVAGADQSTDTVRRAAAVAAAPSDATFVPGAAAAPPVPPPGPVPITDQTKAVSPVSSPPPAPPAPPPPPTAARAAAATVKTPAAQPIKADASPKLPPPPPAPKPAAPPAALRPKAAGGNQTMALLAAAAVVMLVIGGVLTTLWLKSKNGSDTVAQGQDVAKAETPTTAPPPVSIVTTSSAAAVTTTSATTVPVMDGAAPPPSTTSAEPAAVPATAPAPAPASVPPVTTSAPRRSEGPRGVIMAAPKTRESRSALLRRSTDLTKRLNQGKAAIDRGDFAAAIELLTAVERDQPDFGDTAAQLERAREGVKAASRQRAQAAFDDAQQKERQQDFAGALQGYQQAQRLDPDSAARVTAAVSALRAKAKGIADEALKSADAYYKFGDNAKAIPLYRKALTALFDDDPRKAATQKRLNELLGIK